MTTRNERLSRRGRRLEATAVSVAVALTAVLYQLIPANAAGAADCRPPTPDTPRSAPA